jgi:hypothetical protein
VPNVDVIGKDWDVPESAIEIVIDHPSIAELPNWKHMATLGVPPHVTLLYPWRPAPIDAASLGALSAVARQFDQFAMSLARVETFSKGKRDERHVSGIAARSHSATETVEVTRPTRVRDELTVEHDTPAEFREPLKVREVRGDVTPGARP